MPRNSCPYGQRGSLFAGYAGREIRMLVPVFAAALARYCERQTVGGPFHLAHEPVAAARNRFDPPWLFCGVGKAIPEPLDCRVQAVIKINKRILGPQLCPEFLPADQFPGTRSE